jgi:hypothetical protein
VTNWLSAAASPTASPFGGGNPDSDGDGLPDAWELEHFGSLAQTASGDPDGDGFTNEQEYLAGTDPLNGLVIEIVGEGPVTLRFDATSNTTYSILHSSSLAPPNWQRITNIAAGPARTVHVPISTPGASGFYRLRAPALP